MQDSQLKTLLLETHPVRPGQEERAWAALKGRLSAPMRPGWDWLYLPSWRATGVAAAAVLLLASVGSYVGLRPTPLSFLSADSQSPGIYATAFYSKSAGAQVVWLNGLDPATDKPTYLDPTTEVKPSKSAQPVGEPNSL
jgi:hypothetical protein